MKKLKKRILQTIIACLMVLGIGLLSESTVEAGVQGFWQYEEIDNETIRLTGYTGAELNVSIPSKIEGKKVTELGSKLFADNKYIETVKIPSTVKKVYSSCFANCKELKTVQGFENVTDLKSDYFYIFKGCEKLENIKLSKNLKEIPWECFKDCKSLKNIEIPSSVESIGQETFANCVSLTTITIPESVVELCDDAFANCDSLHTVYLNMTGGDIGSAFYGCDALENVTIGNKVTAIGYYCFSECDSLKSIVIPKNVRHIRAWAFVDSKLLSDVTLNYGLLTVGMNAFSGCASLEKIDLPNSVVDIDSAFSGCTSLKSITIPNSVAINEEEDVYVEPFGYWGVCDYSGVINCYAGSDIESIAKAYKEGEDYGDYLEYTINILKAIPSTSFSFEKKAIYLPKGYWTQLGYTIAPGNTTDAIVWESSASEIVSVNGLGEITAKKEGSATIIATTTSGKRATINVIVYNAVDLSDTKIGFILDKVYTGKAIKPAVPITYDGQKLKKGTDYVVTYKNNKNIGTATVIIDGKGKYIGRQTLTFQIIPKKVNLKSVKVAKKKAKLTWEKQKGISGYEIYMSNSKSSGYKKIKTIKKPSTTKYTTGTLKKGVRYYYKVRSYKTVKGKKIYGNYSKIKSVKRTR